LENLTPPKDFSPFPHGTYALSVSSVFLGLEDGSPIFKQDFTCLVLLGKNSKIKAGGLSPTLVNNVPLFLL